MKQILILICLICAVDAQAQDDEKPRVWKVELTGALNNYSAWEVEPSITYQPIPYVGVTFGLLFCNTILDEHYSGVTKDKQWVWSDSEDNPTCHTIAFRPGIQLATPAIVLGKDKDMGLSFIVSPGLTIAPPANKELEIEYVPNAPGVWIPQRFDRVKNTGGRSLYYHIKGMLSLDIDGQYTLSAGYAFSDFDMYGGIRNITVEGEKLSMSKRQFMHSFFISIGYRF